MDVNIEQRLEAIVYFAKVFFLDYAFHTLELDLKAQLLEVQDQLNTVDNSWVSTYSSQRPAGHRDKRPCDSPAWGNAHAHIEMTFKRYIRSGATPVGQVVSLIHRLDELDSAES
jgi:hypothetical protein